MQTRDPNNRNRDIPSYRVAAFIERYIAANYELDEKDPSRRGKFMPSGTGRFSAEVLLPERTISGIRRHERTNVSFDLVDQILTRLDLVCLWHTDPEDGGFSDYYGDISGPAANPTIDQQRQNEIFSAKRKASRCGLNWTDVLRDRALSAVPKNIHVCV